MALKDLLVYLDQSPANRRTAAGRADLGAATATRTLPRCT